MFIPQRNIPSWATELVHACTADLDERIQRGAMYRNLYLTGDPNGQPVTYPKTNSYIDNQAAWLFSPEELAFKLRFHNGGNKTLRRQGMAASSELRVMLSNAGVYDVISSAVEWALVKGCSFIKLLWDDGDFKPHLIQPESMGVLLPNKPSLAEQPAFTHSTYYTPSQFMVAFSALENLQEIIKQTIKQARLKEDDRPDRANQMKQIVLGGLNPYKQAGTSSNNNTGIVDWLGSPSAQFDSKTLAELIRVDELWVRDSRTNDWATFHIVGNVMVTGDKAIRNSFSDMYDPENKERSLGHEFREHNPLSGIHPFVLVSPNKLDGYLWGRSELCNVGVAQMQINKRISGIQRLLRQQEDPSRFFSGGTGITRDKYSALKLPGAYFVDPSPTAKMQDVFPKLPEGLWESLHEIEAIFDEMSGLPPVLKGRGESGVRAQGHAETLTRNASPRFKKDALSVERSVEDLANLALSILRAKDPRTLVAWLDPTSENVAANLPADMEELEPPTPGMKPLPFQWRLLPDDARVIVDSHSASPAFIHEARSLMFDLAKAGAVTPEQLVEHTNPPGEDDIVADLHNKAIEQAKLMKEHPELLAQLMGGSKKHK